MKTHYMSVENIPMLLWGGKSNKVFLYIHGQFGSKTGAEAFAQVANEYNWQVISFDLPEHGVRIQEKNTFVPWFVIPELQKIMRFIKKYWERVSLYAESIGAWFSLLGLNNEIFEKCLFVSPVVDMYLLVSTIMKNENISENQLQKSKIIQTKAGQTLSWNYLQYIKQHPILKCFCNVKILYGGQDELIEQNRIIQFAKEFNCDVTIFEKAKHWFGAKDQLPLLKIWLHSCFQ